MAIGEGPLVGHDTHTQIGVRHHCGNRAFDRHHVEQRGNGDDLVRFFVHLDLSEHEALAGGEGRDHVNRRFRVVFLIGAARHLSVDRDDLDLRLGQRRRPGDAAAVERSRVERGENIGNYLVDVLENMGYAFPQIKEIPNVRSDKPNFHRRRKGPRAS